jgi:hypothetical protein
VLLLHFSRQARQAVNAHLSCVQFIAWHVPMASAQCVLKELLSPSTSHSCWSRTCIALIHMVCLACACTCPPADIQVPEVRATCTAHLSRVFLSHVRCLDVLLPPCRHPGA